MRETLLIWIALSVIVTPLIGVVLRRISRMEIRKAEREVERHIEENCWFEPPATRA